MLTGTVTGKFARIVSRDGILLPPACLTVTFEALTPGFTDGAKYIIPDTVTCHLDKQGRILDPTDPEEKRLGVELAASENEPQGFAYEVRISSPYTTTTRAGITVHANQTADLTDNWKDAS